eukprot:9200721-Alexandrium_andersonii.AAC.1
MASSASSAPIAVQALRAACKQFTGPSQRLPEAAGEGTPIPCRPKSAQYCLAMDAIGSAPCEVM